VSDLVGTCPKGFWEEWIAEGDAAGDPHGPDNIEWSWYTRHSLARTIQRGDRFYVVAHGKLRGWAPVTRVGDLGVEGYEICRRGGAVACTIPQAIPGFRGLRARWWKREEELRFENWRTA
jgi:hypothetical protein